MRLHDQCRCVGTTKLLWLLLLFLLLLSFCRVVYISIHIDVGTQHLIHIYTQTTQCYFSVYTCTSMHEFIEQCRGMGINVCMVYTATDVCFGGTRWRKAHFYDVIRTHAHTYILCMYVWMDLILLLITASRKRRTHKSSF